MGVMLITDKEETVLDVRLANAKQDAAALRNRLRRAWVECSLSTEREMRDELDGLALTAMQIERRLAELISTKGKR